MNYLFLVFWCLSISMCSNAQLSLSGKYTGKNLYFQNPMDDEEGGYCADSIYINGTRVHTELNIGAFEIDLKSMDFTIGDSIWIKIYHKTACKPLLLKSFHTPKKSEPLFVKIYDDVLTLESPPLNIEIFNVELYRWNKWISIGNLDTLNSFLLDGNTHTGLNLIRVVSIDHYGRKQPSNEVKFSGNKKKVTFDYSRKKKSLTFSRLTSFELFNRIGQIILSGNNEFIDLSNLKKGKYYLNFDNENTKLKIR